MRTFFAILLLISGIERGLSQTRASFVSKLPALDISPLEIAYLPDNYPMLKTQAKMTDPALARVIYSRPQKNNRVIFGDLIEYGKVWRLGANEATEIELFKDAIIGGKKIPKGRYTLYAIPLPTRWTIILNRDTDAWGAFIYDTKKDVVRVEVPVLSVPAAIEPFTMHFEKTDAGANLVIAWDTVSVALPMLIR